MPFRRRLIHRYLVVGIITLSSVQCVGGMAAVEDCGTSHIASSNGSLTPAAPSYQVATPSTAQSGDASCLTTYLLTFRWASDTRANSDATQPPLFLAQEFQYAKASGGNQYYTAVPAPTVSATPPYTWKVLYLDHASGSGSNTTVYSIITSLNSGLAADAVSLSGSITYYTIP